MLSFKQYIENKIVSVKNNPFEAMIDKHPDAYKWMEIYDQAYKMFVKNYKANPSSPVSIQLGKMLYDAQQGNYDALKTWAYKLGA